MSEDNRAYVRCERCGQRLEPLKVEKTEKRADAFVTTYTMGICLCEARSVLSTLRKEAKGREE